MCFVKSVTQILEVSDESRNLPPPGVNALAATALAKPKPKTPDLEPNPSWTVR